MEEEREREEDEEEEEEGVGEVWLKECEYQRVK